MLAMFQAIILMCKENFYKSFVSLFKTVNVEVQIIVNIEYFLYH